MISQLSNPYSAAVKPYGGKGKRRAVRHTQGALKALPRVACGIWEVINEDELWRGRGEGAGRSFLWGRPFPTGTTNRLLYLPGLLAALYRLCSVQAPQSSRACSPRRRGSQGQRRKLGSRHKSLELVYLGHVLDACAHLSTHTRWLVLRPAPQKDRPQLHFRFPLLLALWHVHPP